MNIECPKCKNSNNISVSEIKCGSCQHDLSSFNFKVTKKRLISTTAALILGAAGYHQADKYIFQDRRFPHSVEYAYIEACVNGDSRLISEYQYVTKRNLCLCAMEKTSKELPDMNSDDVTAEFNRRFKANLFTCR